MTNEDRIETLYTRVFSTEEGKQVLADILNDVGFFSLHDMNEPADIARLNVGRRILSKMGRWTEDNLFDITQVYVAGHKGFFKRLLLIGRRFRDDK